MRDYSLTVNPGPKIGRKLTLDPPPPKPPKITPKADPSKRGPKPGDYLDTSWETPFLNSFIEWGSVSKACQIAGVPRQRIVDRRNRSEDFKQRFRDAKRAFIEGLEEDMVRLGRDHKNVIAILARLKAERPEKYHEKLQVEGRILRLNVNITDDEAKVFLREMLAAARPSTLKALTDAPPDAVEAEFVSHEHPNQQEIPT